MKILCIATLLLFSFLPSPAAADSLSCENGIVSSGDGAADLLLKCGQPEWKNAHEETVVESLDKDSRRKTVILVEEWTYNLGPDRFMRIVTVRNGVVTAVRTGGYGTAKDPSPPGPGCGDRIISVGDRKADVLIRCGEPFSTTSRQEEVRERIEGGSRTIAVTVEEWTYNFGPHRFLRVITFRNGVVTDVRTGGYGR